MCECKHVCTLAAFVTLVQGGLHLHTATVVAPQQAQLCFRNSTGYGHIHTHHIHIYIHLYTHSPVYTLLNYKENKSGKKMCLGLPRFMSFADIFLLAQNKMEHDFTTTINMFF